MKVLKRLYDMLFFEQWALLYDKTSGMPGTTAHYIKLLPPKDRFWADPHVIYRNGLYYIFIEEYIYKDKKAHISVISTDGNGSFSDPVEVLSAPYHLSYPFVFEYQGDMYLIPESCENHSIDLYKATQFPYKWEHHRNIMSDVIAVDTTLYFRGDRCWLFTNIAEEEGENTWRNLYLFSSTDLHIGDWTAHRKNPIVKGANNARPAGALFEYRGKLYRPSQNSSIRYGYGFNLNEVLCLTDEDYQEKTVIKIVPDWTNNIVATHTFSQKKDLTIIDGQVRRFRWFA